MRSIAIVLLLSSSAISQYPTQQRFYSTNRVTPWGVFRNPYSPVLAEPPFVTRTRNSFLQEAYIRSLIARNNASSVNRIGNLAGFPLAKAERDRRLSRAAEKRQAKLDRVKIRRAAYMAMVKQRKEKTRLAKR